jgi:plastocyanin
MSRRILLSMLALLLAACTAGGTPVASGGSGGATIDVNLTLSQPVKTAYGESGGYTPAITNVAVGSEIHFTNTDSFAHTATEIPNATQFPDGSRLQQRSAPGRIVLADHRGRSRRYLSLRLFLPLRRTDASGDHCAIAPLSQRSRYSS